MPTKHEDCPHLLSLAVHEFRTPVTVVSGYLRMLLKLHGASMGDGPRKLVEEAEKSCGRMAGLIAELSELSHADSGGLALEHKPMDFGELVAEVAGRVHEGAERDVRLAVARPDHALPISGDRRRLATSLEAVMVATLRERADPGIVMAACGSQQGPEGEIAWLVLAPDGDMDHRFTPAEWAPLDQWRGGMGFRLLIAQAVVAAHGGRIYSGPGARARGTCALSLPLGESHP